MCFAWCILLYAWNWLQNLLDVLFREMTSIPWKMSVLSVLQMVDGLNFKAAIVIHWFENWSTQIKEMYKRHQLFNIHKKTKHIFPFSMFIGTFKWFRFYEKAKNVSCDLLFADMFCILGRLCVSKFPATTAWLQTFRCWSNRRTGHLFLSLFVLFWSGLVILSIYFLICLQSDSLINYSWLNSLYSNCCGWHFFLFCRSGGVHMFKTELSTALFIAHRHKQLVFFGSPTTV